MSIYSFTFSPTGTSAQISRSITSGISEALKIDIHHADLTFNPAGNLKFSHEDIVIISSPVYGGKIAPLTKQRLSTIQGNGAKCIVVAVYGNRAFENALTDLSEFMSDHGFQVCSAGAFVGEHSYSTPATPIAQGRPDRKDLIDAHTYGKEIGAKICSGHLNMIDVSALLDEPSPTESLINFRNFVMKYQQEQSLSPKKILPVVDMQLCDECGSCYASCPTGAITADSNEVDSSKCIKCCACVKICPQNARALSSPFAEPLSENFNRRKSPKWIL